MDVVVQGSPAVRSAARFERVTARPRHIENVEALG